MTNEEKYEKEAWDFALGNFGNSLHLNKTACVRGYLAACRKRQEEIDKLKSGLKEAIHELECSGYCYDHPSLIQLRSVIEDK